MDILKMSKQLTELNLALAGLEQHKDIMLFGLMANNEQGFKNSIEQLKVYSLMITGIIGEMEHGTKLPRESGKGTVSTRGHQ